MIRSLCPRLSSRPLGPSASARLFGVVLCLSAMTWLVPTIWAATPKADLRRAEAIHAEGKRRYKGGDYAIALGLFTKAFELDPRPDRRYNMGRCLEQLGRLDEARAMLQAYADETQDVAGAEEARLRVAAIDKELARRRAAAAAAPQAPPTEQRASARAAPPAVPLAAAATPTSAVAQPPRGGPPTVIAPSVRGVTAPAPRSRWLEVGAISLGGAAALAGGVVYWRGVAEDDSLEARLVDRDAKGRVTDIDAATARDAQARSTRLRTAGVVTGSAGLALAVAGGLAWWLGGAPDVAVAGRSWELAWRF